VLFDWDGTVVDSAKLGLQAFTDSFAALGLEFDYDIYREVYSPNWYSIYEALGLPKEKWARADELWVKFYGEQTAQPIAGAEQTIAELKRRGYRLGVVSSGSECRVSREIKELGFAECFETVICNEHMEQKKPHPEGLETALRLLGCANHKTAYVGDSPEDIEMGKRANMVTVGVRSDYPTSWKLQQHSPDIFIESITDLLQYF
jgi:phosphoglycolate phosphatase